MRKLKSKNEKGKTKSNMLKVFSFNLWFLLFTLAFLLSACAHPAYEAKEQVTPPISKVFNTDANQAYYAVQWALKTCGYPTAKEDLDNGIIESTWLASKVDSFYLSVFDRPDYGVNGAYYMLEVRIVPQEEKTQTKVEVISHVKSMVAHLKSSGINEKKILKHVADYLRKKDFKVTNVGIIEE